MNKQCLNGFKRLFLLFLLFTTSYSFAQKTEQQVLDSAEVMPQFPGGVSKMMEYLKVPVSDALLLENGTQGCPVIQFVVEKDGNISNSKVVRSVDPQLDSVALKLIEKMPTWIPGIQNERKVRVRMTVPVFTILESSLKLEEQEKNKQYEKTGGETSENAWLIIDGVEVGTNFLLSYLNVELIKNFKILKGKEALDRYGEKGQNGVILITLKSPKELKAKTVGEKVVGLLKDRGFSKKTPIVYCFDEKEFSPDASAIISKNEYNEEKDFIAIKEVKDGIAYVIFKNNSSFYIK
ncbi:energy transducer TonB [Bacteroides sp.]|uniref:energy transducer TonB n=1 Tax=Bacteroides sp. TaxID=29523 RepID=UPI002610F0AA|nr:energy transducer TonB [Bacteroides sp.]MDD3037107.1 energy transducer TonB [Bacteroides sp.]